MIARVCVQFVAYLSYSLTCSQSPCSIPMLWKDLGSPTGTSSLSGSSLTLWQFCSNLTPCFSGKRRDTVLLCLGSEDVEDGCVQLNRGARNNTRVRLGDLVSIYPCVDIEYGKSIHILPCDDGSIEGLNDIVYIKYIKDFFYEGM
jgi:hypothetical protein